MTRRLSVLLSVGVALSGCRKHATRDAGPFVVVPDPEPHSAHRIRTLVSGMRQTCALYNDGSVACWGEGAEQSLPHPIASHTAVKMVGVQNAERLSVGPCNACALDASGTLTCWGYRGTYCAPIHEGAELILPKPTVIDGVRFRNVPASSSYDFLCGLDAGGETHCIRPQCLTPPAPSASAPCLRAKLTHAVHSNGAGFYAPGALDRAVEITTAGASCVREADGHARCWSDGITNGEGAHFVSLDAPTEPVTFMAGVFQVTCFVLRSGGVECRSTDGIAAARPASPARTVAGGYRKLCATSMDGSLTCWQHPEPTRRANPELLATTVLLERKDAKARNVVSDGDTFCTLDEADVVRCGVETTAPYEIALP